MYPIYSYNYDSGSVLGMSFSDTYETELLVTSTSRMPPPRAIRSPDRTQNCYFAVVHIINKPSEPSENSVAKSVAFKVSYYDKDGNPRLGGMAINGRWWSQNEPELGKNPRDIESIDLPPNPRGETLALACMVERESAIYAYNNESHSVGVKDYKKTEFSLGLSNYHVHIKLGGTNLKESDYWFYIWRDSASGRLEIKSEEVPEFFKFDSFR